MMLGPCEHVMRTVYIKATRRSETTHHKKQTWVAIGHVCVVCMMFTENGTYRESAGRRWDIVRGTR